MYGGSAATHGCYKGSRPSEGVEQLLGSGIEHHPLSETVREVDAQGVMWGDAGTLYSWVREAPAREGKFQDAWLVLQCY
ncbi:DUF1963 domain-containing protein [Roseateles sp. P5_D6]